MASGGIPTPPTPLPRRSPEHLALMPRHELILRQVSRTLRLAQWLPVEVEEPLAEALCPVCQFGNLHIPAERQTVRSAVEQLVVQCAQASPFTSVSGPPAWCHLMCAASRPNSRFPSRTS